MKKFLFSLVLVLILPLSFVFVGCTDKLKSIRLDLTDVQVEYVEGQVLSISKLRVYARYANKGEKEVANFVVDSSDVDKDKPGTYSIAVTFEGKTKTFNVTYYNKGSMVVRANNKYYIGQEFKSANPQIVYTSGKGQVIELVDEYSVVSFDSSTAGEKTAVLSYGGYTYDVKVEVLSNDDYLSYILRNTKAASEDFLTSSVTFKSNDILEAYISNQLIYLVNGEEERYIDMIGYEFTKEGGHFTKSQDVLSSEQIHSLIARFEIDRNDLPSYYKSLINKIENNIASMRAAEGGANFTFSVENSMLKIIMFNETLGAYTVDINLMDYSVSSVYQSKSDSSSTIIINSKTIYSLPEV